MGLGFILPIHLVNLAAESLLEANDQLLYIE